MAIDEETTTTTTTEPRAIIRYFAAAMERKLAANDGIKGGWMRADWRGMMRLLRQEVGELYEALDAWAENMYSDESAMLAEIRDEAADVGNIAAMIAQRVGALPPTDERGR